LCEQIENPAAKNRKVGLGKTMTADPVDDPKTVDEHIQKFKGEAPPSP
jgi:hypothetical protein